MLTSAPYRPHRPYAVISAHIFCICVAFFACAVSLHAQTISTVAGSSTTGFAGDNAAATSALMNQPTGVVVDSAGNLYIADLGNNRIRKVTATGIITTVAGTGAAGFSGDGAAATAAQLNSPSRVAVDSAGNLYIADASNNRIRKVTAATGFISTIAGTGVNGFSGDGGAATSAQIGNARGVTVDSAGNIYVADNDNNRIRKIDALSGIITTVAGNGAATFSGDGGLATAAGIGSNAFEAAVDSAGNIFFVSQTTNRIRRVSAATGIITTVAGTGTQGFSGDGGAATAAQVAGPIGVATDSAGNVYIADLNNHRIRKITVATGIITTLAGTGVAGFSGDGAAAVNARLNQPFSIAVDSAGNIYVADNLNHRIRKISPVAPSAPTIGTATAGNAQATVTFTAPASDGLSTITSYTATSNPSNITGSCTAPCTSITVTGLVNQAYTFTVTATNGIGTSIASSPSNSVTPTTVPSAPTITGATPGNGNVLVAFTAGATGGSPITSFTANCGMQGQSGTSSPISVAGLTNGIAVTCTVSANNANGSSVNSAASASVTPIGPQTITFGTQSAQTYAPSPTNTFALNPLASATSSLTVAYTSATPTICTIAGSTVTIVKAGTCTINANQAGNASFSAAPQVAQSITINPAVMPTVFLSSNPASIVFGGTASLGTFGGANSNPPAPTFSYATSTPSICSVNSTTGAVTTITAGICVATGTIGDANGNYLSGTSAPLNITISQATQTTPTVSSTAPSVVFGGTVTLSSGGGSGTGAVTFATSTPLICSVNATTGVVSTTTAGICTVTASKAADTNYLVANSAPLNITISQAAQTTFTVSSTPPSLAFGGTVTLSGGGGSGTGAVTFATSTPLVCSVNATTGAVSTTTVGTCTVTASKAADTNYLIATSAPLNISITQATQTITFTPPASVFVGAAPITLTATGGASMLPVTFASQTPTICTTTGVNGVTLTFLGAGNCTVRASQAGNASFIAAADVNRNISIGTPAPPPSPPAIPQVACVIKPAGGITCGFIPGTPGAPGLNTAIITGYQISCANPNGVVVAIQSSTGSTINLPTLPVGTIYTCTVTAMSSVGASNPAIIRIAPQLIPLANRGQFDFDGNGFAAILVRGFVAGSNASNNTEGSKATTATSQVGRWDGTKLTFTTIADVGADWNVLGLGDLTSTGKSALISRNAAANVRIDLNFPLPLPPTSTSGIIVRDARLDWVVEAVGDLDGDGKADILWRYIKPGTNDSGVTFAWFMDGTETTVNVNEVKHRGGAPLSWSLAGIIDLNGDKLGDIVWVSPTNQVRALMGQPGRTWSNQLIGQLPVGYTILKLGDVDGDGKADIVMRDSEGNVKVWLMNGTTIRSTIDLPQTDKRWQFYAAGDFDGNGTMDIVWLTPDGSLTLWLVNPTNVAFPTIVPNAGTAPPGLVPVEP
jgi:trimeric autotransporter adhesin